MLRWRMRLAPLLRRVLDNPVQERHTDEEMRTGESDVKKPRVAATGALTVCELAVCEDGGTIRVLIQLIPRRSARCGAKCHDRGHRCQLREGHFKCCACRPCLTITPESRWTKICTRRDEMVNCEPCKTMASVLRHPSERPWAANTSVDFPLLT